MYEFLIYFGKLNKTKQDITTEIFQRINAVFTFRHFWVS